MTTYSSYLHKKLEQIPFDLFDILSNYIKLRKNIKIAFVGGYLRDLLINKIHSNCSYLPVDLDIIVEGSAIDLALYIKRNISNVSLCLIKEYEIYKTVELNIDNFKVDIASARTEEYLSPGLNPNVYDSTIIEDLARRDFTINSIAYEINTRKLIDIFDGINHIKMKELHLLHQNSISDDPSRILRCAKYASRFRFKISKSSLIQAQETIDKWPWHAISKKSLPPGISIRMRMELSEILKYDSISRIVSELYRWGLISIINKEINVNNKFLRGLNWIKRIKGKVILYLIKDSESLELLCERFFINKKERKILDDYRHIKNILDSNRKNFLNFKPSNWTEFIESNNLHTETAKLIISDGSNFWRPFFRWLFLYRFIKSNKNGEQLKNEGWIQGEEIGTEIKRLRYIEIDKKI